MFSFSERRNSKNQVEKLGYMPPAKIQQFQCRSSSPMPLVHAAFLADFCSFLLSGCSRIFKTSSSMIFFSVLNLVRSGIGGALRRVRPFLVMARKSQSRDLVRGDCLDYDLTNSAEESSNRCSILVTDDFVLPENIAPNALNNSHLGVSFIFKLS